MVSFGETHLRRILCAYAAYNQARTRLALQKDAPLRSNDLALSPFRSRRTASSIRPDMIFGKDRTAASRLFDLNGDAKAGRAKIAARSSRYHAGRSLQPIYITFSVHTVPPLLQ